MAPVGRSRRSNARIARKTGSVSTLGTLAEEFGVSKPLRRGQRKLVGHIGDAMAAIDHHE